MENSVRQSLAQERDDFDKRVAQRSTVAHALTTNADNSIWVTTASLPAHDGAFEISSGVMLALNLAGCGRYVCATDDWEVDAIMHPNTLAITLPDMVAEGKTPEAQLLGIALDARQVEATLAECGGVMSLEAAAQDLHADPLIQAVMVALWRDAEAHGLSSAFFEHGISMILRRLAGYRRPSTPDQAVRPMSLAALTRTKELIESRLDSDITVSEIAQEIGQDRRSLTVGFQAATGFTPHKYLTYRRMERAKSLLRTGQRITDVSLEVGYANPAKFAAAFRRIYGQSPSEWRKNMM